MRILLTGGAGFIGSHVLRVYLEAGHEVVVVDDLSGGRRENVPFHVPFYRVDVCDQDALEDLVRKVKPDVINHHAGLVSVRQSQSQKQRYMQVNTKGTANVLGAARSTGVQKFIYASSGGAIYGNDQKLPIQETASLAPISPYGESKVLSESLFMKEDKRMKFVILRYGNVYGPGQDPSRDNGVIAIFAHHLLRGKKARIYGDGSHTRDFIFVHDVAQANLKALEPGMTGVFNIASGDGHRVEEVYDLIRDLVGISLTPKHQKPNPYEVQDVVLDVARAEAVLGWKARVEFEEGLTQTVMGMAARMAVASVSVSRER
jgi:UDP-glucose 4-epimerase